MSIDLKQQCPGVLNKISGIANDGSNTAIPELYAESKANKKVLATKLGLLDEYRVECVESTFDINKYPQCIDLVKLLVKEEISTSDIINNKTPSGAKISRIVCKCEPKDVSSALKIVPTMVKAMAELSIDSDVDDLVSGLDYLKKSVATFSAKFWEIIAAESEIISGFSLDFLDILNAANSTSFTSCFALGGSSSAGPLQVARYPLSGVIYVRQSNNNIIGRCWVVFSKDFNSFHVLRRYGNLTLSMVHTLSKWLCSRLNPDGMWVLSSGRERIHVSAEMCGWYEDPIDATYSDLRGKSRTIRPDYPSMAGTYARCISCGEDLGRDNTLAVCSTCKRPTGNATRRVSQTGRDLKGSFGFCSMCEKYYVTDGKISLCPSCAKEEISCAKCGSKFVRTANQLDIATSSMRSSLLSSDFNKYRYTNLCPDCLKKHPCVVCGAPLEDSPYPVCKSCADLFNVNVCEVCGEVGQTYPAAGHALCPLCHAEANSLHNTGPIKGTVESLIEEAHNDR